MGRKVEMWAQTRVDGVISGRGCVSDWWSVVRLEELANYGSVHSVCIVQQPDAISESRARRG